MSTITTTHPETVVCDAALLEPDLGVAALLNDGRQVAVFRLSTPDGDGGDRILAVGNIDPYTGAAVISRGIVGDHNARPVVASPLLKQRFHLDDGTSLQDDGLCLPVYPVRVDDGRVVVAT